MIIKADEDSLARMLGVPAAQIPESVLAEYELRLRMFHCDGNSGPLGTIGIIDLLRNMKLGVRQPAKPPATVDWSVVPMNGTVRVIARIAGDGDKRKWVSGVYAGQVGVGTLAVRLDGDRYVHEIHRADVRIARDEPMKPISPEDAVDPEAPLADRQPWVSLPVDDSVMVEVDDDYKEGRFQGVEGDEILVVLDGQLTSQPFAPELVTCLENRLQATAEK